MGKVYWIDVNGDWTNAANWAGSGSGAGGIPGAGDDVYILSGSQQIVTNLNQSAVTLLSLHVGMGFLGTIGSSTVPLQISATTWEMGVPVSGGGIASGSGRIWVDFGSVQYNGSVYNTSSTPLDAATAPTEIKGSHASNVLTVYGGTVGVGHKLATDTATVLTATVLGGNLIYGPAVGWTNVKVGGGYFTCNGLTGATGILTTSPGTTATVYGANKLANVSAGGVVNLNNRTGGAVIADIVTILSTGKLDVSGNVATGTMGATSFAWYKGGQFVTNPSNPDHVTFANLNRINGGTLTLS